MTVKEVVKRYDLSPEELEKELKDNLEGYEENKIRQLYEDSLKQFKTEAILEGTVLKVLEDGVLVDVGYKSEGIVPLDQFENVEEIKEGDKMEVLLESVEEETGMIVLSKRKADRIRGWERIIQEHKEGDVVKGKVIRKIKGGLLLDISVPVFLPASQVDVRRTGEIGDWIGKEIECKIIKIDKERMNIVVSRRKLIEEQREAQKKELLAKIQEGDVVKGVVKNIADFGAFVDLGGIDGLLHITDISWGRISSPSDVLSLDDEIEVKVIKFDKEKERISLGLKQLTPNPWENVEEKYPVGTHLKGTVVNILPYGAFVKLEEGIEGLVHISEMSWTRRINHPSDIVSLGQEVDVVILDVNKEKQEISLSIKQTEGDPWDVVEEKYPVGSVVEGYVRNLTNYGAFIELEEGIDGLVHISDLSWVKKVNHPSELLKKGDLVRAKILSIDKEKRRIALGIKQLSEDPWEKIIPDAYEQDTLHRGKVTKITNFGVFVELEDNLEGLLHISELADRKIEDPSEIVKVGDEIIVKVIKLDKEERKIGLSLKRVTDEDREALEQAEQEFAQQSEENQNNTPQTQEETQE
ncbi:MAG: 30S ribosomal protein S1 [Planctomycetota bacterium]|nr:MAG: 30S ribosomal protein S1 [Planctomycetota bacterium]